MTWQLWAAAALLAVPLAAFLVWGGRDALTALGGTALIVAWASLVALLFAQGMGG